VKIVFYRLEHFRRAARDLVLYEVTARYSGSPLPGATVTLRLYSLDERKRVVVYEESRRVSWSDVEEMEGSNYFDQLDRAVRKAAEELEERAKKEFPKAVPGRLEG